MKNNILLIFAAAITLSWSPAKKNLRPFPAKKERNIIVLCDISKSIDDNVSARNAVRNRFKDMINQCQSILTAYPPNTTFSFFFISRNGNAAPFARLTSEEVNDNNGRAMMEKFEKCKAWLSTSINKRSADPESQSCVLTSIESAYITLRGLSAGKRIEPSEIIVISDMVEVCWASPVDTLVMNVKNGKYILSPKAMNKIRSYHSNMNFDSLKIGLKILFNAGVMDIKKEKQLEDTWRVILGRYGYKYALDPNHQLFLTNFSFQKDSYYVNKNLNF